VTDGGSALGDAAADLADYLPLLEALLPEHAAEGQPSVTMSGSTESRPPWNPAAGDVLTTIHAGARRLERQLRVDAGLPVRARGGSSENTLRAIRSIADIGATAPRGVAAEAARKLASWASSAARLPGIDEAPTWTPLRRGSPAGLPPACPYCGTYSLRVARPSGVVACFLPGCADSDGSRPLGRPDYSKVTGRPVLAWNDGLVQGE
jgi:hypothetical protein